MKALIIFMISFNLIFAISNNAKPSKYKDFGIEAETYEIIEPDFEEILKKEMLKLKLTKAKVKKEIEKSVKKAAIYKKQMKLCDKNIRNNWEKDYYTLDVDLYNPMGRVWKKAGEKVLAPKLPPGLEKNICFIEGSNIIAAKNQIEFFQKKFGDCLYLVNNQDVRTLLKKFKYEKIYPNQKATEDRFKLECLPASITFKGDSRKINYYDYEYFKTEN